MSTPGGGRLSVNGSLRSPLPQEASDTADASARTHRAVALHFRNLGEQLAMARLA